MARTAPDDVFSSSPAHPSHTRNPNPQPPKRNLKRTASVASLPSPPRTTVKRAHYSSVSALEAEKQDNEDEVERAESPTPAAQQSASARKQSSGSLSVPSSSGLLAVHASAARSPSPYHETAPSISAGLTTVAVDEPLEHHDEGSGALTDDDTDTETVAGPRTPRQAPVTPPPTRRRVTRAHPGPIRDSPNNPFLTSSPRRPLSKPHIPLEERETIDYVFRGVKTTFANPYSKKTFAPGEVDPSTLDPTHPDFSPDPSVKPQLLWPSSPKTPDAKSQKASGKARRPSTPEARSPSSSSQDSIPAERPFARRLFTEEIAKQGTSTASTTAKAKAMKEGIKKGKMTGSMVIAHAHGPVRAGKETAASVRPGISRESSHVSKLAASTVKAESKSGGTAPARRASSTASKARVVSTSKPAAPPVWRG